MALQALKAQQDERATQQQKHRQQQHAGRKRRRESRKQKSKREQKEQDQAEALVGDNTTAQRSIMNLLETTLIGYTSLPDP